MKLQQRSYVGKNSMRPKPQIFYEKNPDTLLIITPWGNSDGIKKVAETIMSQIQTAQNPDATNPFEIIPDLGDIGNHIRISLLLANDWLYRNYNRTEYSVGFEIMLLVKSKSYLYWGAYGLPHLLLANKNNDVIPLSFSPEWAAQIQPTPSVFSEAIGLERALSLRLGSMYLSHSENEIILISRNSIPKSFYSLPFFSTQSIQDCLIEDDPHQPFWLGVIFSESLS